MKYAPPPQRDAPNPCVQEIPTALLLLLVMFVRCPDRIKQAWKETPDA